MGLHKLTAGDGYTYLTRQVAAHDATEKGHSSLGDYYAEQGESPGLWLGSGLAGLGLRPGQRVTAEQMKALFGQGRHPNAVALEAAAAAQGADPKDAAAAGALGRPFNVYDAASTFNTQVARAFTTYNREHDNAWDAAIPVEVRAEIRTSVGQRMFTEQHNRAPLNARELAGFVARASRQATSAVAGYDLTFSPVKSVSTLWALAPREVADEVRAAHHAAVADAVGWLEREAAFTRLGHGGARQVTTRGLVATAFTHRDTRAGDPDLHTHVAVSNKVEAAEPGRGREECGRWLALDGRLIYQSNVAASERYNTRLEAELTARLGVRFVETPAAGAKRPIRELDGINTLLNRWWSRRRRDIEARRSQLAAQFQTRHARPPTAVEAITLAQQASLETRAPKHAPTSEAEQRQAWNHEAADVLGGTGEVEEMLQRTLEGNTHATQRLGREWVAAAAAAAVAATEASRATWQVWHLRAEAERQARAAHIELNDLEDAVNRIVEQSLTTSVRLGAADPVQEPAVLRRADGTSVYEVHGAARFTSTRIIAAEQQILDLAGAAGGRAITEVRVGIAVAESAANGVELNDAQAAMVRDLATSGSRLQLALAPAGTGKTTAMRVLSQAWTDSGGQILGLAPSAQAAHEFGHAIETAAGSHTDTLTKLTWTLDHAPHDQWPAWVHDIGPRTLVIIDEAGQAATTELAAAVTYITHRGGIVRLIGDDQQLAAVAAGGVLRDIAHAIGAATLSEVRRFKDPAEAAATLAIRDGDPSALGFYADNDRIHVGDIGAVTDQAYNAWAADKAAGLDTVLLAPTRDLVTHLNTRARIDRLRSPGPVDPTDLATAPDARAEVRLCDGTSASAGDVIVTRRNERRLSLGASNWVKNGDRWMITAVHSDTSITARHLELGCSIRLPASYVADHVQLGYASTVHAAQGMTTDTAHIVVAGEESKQLLYVAISRGRTANHIYLASAHDGDPHSLIRPDTLLPPTAIDVLTGILERDGSQHSATTTKRDLDSPTHQLHDAALRYRDALDYAAEHTLGTHTLTALDTQIEALWSGLTHERSYPALRGHLALIALDGRDPLQLLLDSADSHELSTAEDRAAVLDWRLTTAEEHPRSLQTPGPTPGPLPWLPPPPPPLASSPVWGRYLQARSDRVAALATAVHEQALEWSPTAAPAWAAGLSSPTDATLRADLAVWRAAFAIHQTETRPTGRRQLATEAATHQRELNRRLREANQGHGKHLSGETPHDALPHCVQTDPRRAQLTDRLNSLTTAGLDVTDLLTRALDEAHPLPDEHAADALWWRLLRHLGPATLNATGHTNAHLRPGWVPTLIARVGHDPAQRIMADTAWPALVAAVHARPAHWTAEQLITAVADSHGPPLPVEDLCAAFVWRVATMTDPPEEPEEPEQLQPPNEVHVGREPRHETVGSPAQSAPRTSVQRIVELNREALEHYTAMYPRSWAPTYLQERVGSDLTEHPLFTVGYSPPGPSSLTRHLTNRGATETELVDAGLAKHDESGRLIGAFRDRLVFPIYAGHDLVGFIARRNPTKDQAAYAGPKYLNTRTTAAFTKGQLLFGLAEGAGALTTGATPVLVEGPLDAIAITLATGALAVGIAPLGTAFSDAQAFCLKNYFRHDPTHVVLATDADDAGLTAARKAFWRLAAHGADARHLHLPAGKDPADILRNGSAQALGRAVKECESFAQHMLAIMMKDTDLDDVAARLWLARDAARVIAALPPNQWMTHIAALQQELQLPPGMLNLEVIEAADRWDQDPTHEADRQIRLLSSKSQHQRPDPHHCFTRATSPFVGPSTPNVRPVTRSISPPGRKPGMPR